MAEAQVLNCYENLWLVVLLIFLLGIFVFKLNSRNLSLCGQYELREHWFHSSNTWEPQSFVRSNIIRNASLSLIWNIMKICMLPEGRFWASYLWNNTISANKIICSGSKISGSFEKKMKWKRHVRKFYTVH